MTHHNGVRALLEWRPGDHPVDARARLITVGATSPVAADGSSNSARRTVANKLVWRLIMSAGGNGLGLGRRSECAQDAIRRREHLMQFARVLAAEFGAFSGAKVCERSFRRP